MTLFSNSGSEKGGESMVGGKNAYAPPPAYQNVAQGNQTHIRPMPMAQQPTPKFHFPQTFGIYHAPSSMTNMQLALQKDSPSPLNYITTHSALSSQPSIVLHTTSSPSSPTLGTASFHTFSSAIDLCLFLNPRQPQTTTLSLNSTFSSTRSFTVFVPSSNIVEGFEWKNSSGEEVRRLGGSSHGKKCVRVRTGKVVAAFAAPGGLSMRKKGRMVWVGDRGVLGEAAEVMVVLALVAVLEKARRSNNNAAAAGAIGAGFGGS